MVGYIFVEDNGGVGKAKDGVSAGITDGRLLCGYEGCIPHLRMRAQPF